MTFKQAIQNWLDYKWPKRYTTADNNSPDYTGVTILDTRRGHIFCVNSEGATCLRDASKDRDIKIVPLADPKFFKQLHSLVRQRR